MWSPPMCTSCSWLRACMSNSRGALATCSSTNSGIEEHRVVDDLLAGSPEQVEGLGLHELDAELGQDPLPARVEGLHGLLGEDLVTRHLVDEHGRVLRFGSALADVVDRAWRRSYTRDVELGFHNAELRIGPDPIDARRRTAPRAPRPSTGPPPSWSPSSRPIPPRPSPTCSAPRPGQEHPLAPPVQPRAPRASWHATTTACSAPAPVLTRFAHSARPSDELIALAAPHLETLSEATGETVNLAVMVGPEVEQIAQVDSTLPHGQRELGRDATSPCTARRSARSSSPHGAPVPEGPARAPHAAHHQRAAAASRPSWRRCASGAGPSPTPSSSPGLVADRGAGPRAAGHVRRRAVVSGPSVRDRTRPARAARRPPRPRGGRALTSSWATHPTSSRKAGAA